MTSRHDGEFAAYMAARLTALRRLAFLLCQDWHKADDLAQATAIKTYTHWAMSSRLARSSNRGYRLLLGVLRTGKHGHAQTYLDLCGIVHGLGLGLAVDVEESRRSRPRARQPAP
jgi:hypothetical protein